MSPRLRLSLAAALTAAIVATLDAQPRAEQPAEPLVVSLVPYLSDANLQKELKLTPEQAKSLLAHRQKLWDEDFTTPPNNPFAGPMGTGNRKDKNGTWKTPAAKTAERNKATDTVFKQTLSPEQYLRATQLAAQFVWSRPSATFSPRPINHPEEPDLTRVEIRTLTQHPELTTPLALDDDQKKLINTRFLTNPTLYLTADQTAAIRGFLGPPAKLDWAATPDPRTVGKYPIAALSPVQMVGAKDVQAELKLTDQQVKDVNTIRQKSPFGGRGPTPVLQSRVRESDAFADQIEKLLTPEQLTRLRQITVQQRAILTPAGHPLATPEVQKDLAVTADQKKAIEAAQAVYTEALTTALRNATGVEPLEKALKAAADAREKSLLALLTADQRDKLKVLLGEPFTGSIRPEVLTKGFLPAGTPNRREMYFGRYRVEPLLLAENKAVQDELKLTPDQIERAKAVTREMAAKFPPPKSGPTGPDNLPREKVSEEQSKLIEKALPDLLTPDQAKRFRQIMLQQREASGAPADFPGAVGYPGVAEAVKLTPDQKKTLLTGSDPADVLTPEQQVAILGMLGEPFRADLSARSIIRTPTAAPSPRTQLLLDLPWNALSLTPDQTTKLAVAITKYQLATQSGGAPWGSPELTAAIQALEKAVAAILTPAQLKRLDQLMVLSAVAADLRAAITGPDVSKKLNLTMDQLLKIVAADQDTRRLMALVERVELTPDQRVTARRLLRDRLDERILAVLTPEQRAAWKDLTGDPYPGFRKTIPAFRTGV